MEQIRKFKAKSGYEYGLAYLPSGIFNVFPRVLLLLPDKETKKLNSGYADYIDYDGYVFCYYIRRCKTKAETEDMIQVGEALFKIKGYTNILEKIYPGGLSMFYDCASLTAVSFPANYNNKVTYYSTTLGGI